MIGNYIIAAIIVIICIVVMIFGIRSFKETRDLQSPVNDPGIYRENKEDRPTTRSSRLN
jgi:hypothetical protein